MMSLPIGLLYLLGARIRIDSHPHFRISICYTVKNHWGKIQVSIAGLDAEANVNKNNKRAIEGPVQRDQIFAIVTQVKRNGRMLMPSSMTWKFFERVWINLLPYRGVLMLPYRAVRKVRKVVG